VPVVVDIILVGRTKIITLHSAIWVENNIDRPLALRLHVPTTPLVPPPGGAAAAASTAEGDVRVGPLAPGAGCYLPLTAALGGLLFLRPEGYAEASRDVMRMSASVEEMLEQQGYITCDPLGGLGGAGGGEGPLHVAMEAAPARLMSEFQAFKHVECLAPGLLQRAAAPLEVALSIQPTMVISNALPYEMRVLLWEMAPAEGGGGGEGGGAPTPAPPRAGRGGAFPATPGAAQHAQHASLLEMLSPRTSLAVPPPRRGAPGRYHCYSVPPGGEQDVYVDLRQAVLMHVSVEEINMRSTRWSLCSWAARAQGRGDARETQYTARRAGVLRRPLLALAAFRCTWRGESGFSCTLVKGPRPPLSPFPTTVSDPRAAGCPRTSSCGWWAWACRSPPTRRSSPATCSASRTPPPTCAPCTPSSTATRAPRSTRATSRRRLGGCAPLRAACAAPLPRWCAARPSGRQACARCPPAPPRPRPPRPWRPPRRRPPPHPPRPRRRWAWRAAGCRSGGGRCWGGGPGAAPPPRWRRPPRAQTRRGRPSRPAPPPPRRAPRRLPPRSCRPPASSSSSSSWQRWSWSWRRCPRRRLLPLLLLLLPRPPRCRAGGRPRWRSRRRRRPRRPSSLCARPLTSGAPTRWRRPTRTRRRRRTCKVRGAPAALRVCSQCPPARPPLLSPPFQAVF
jgi:hypothetical protein